MRSSRWLPVVLVFASILLVTSAAVAQEGQLWVGPNVNMVSGTTFPDGDPFLQRQNEPSIAVSTRNTMHLMGFVNDYRAVDIPFPIDEKTTGDAWLGVFKSFDGGQTWRSTLLPGYPQEDFSTSPLFGYEAGADPVVRAGTHGLFYMTGIVFDRDETARSAVFVSRYMDLNNLEGGDPISYIDTTRVAWNDVGDFFIDKPWLAVDIPRGTEIVTLQVPQGIGYVEQTIECGNVYLAWAEIEGIEPDFFSTIRFTRSTDCGETWSETPIALSDSGSMSQGVTVAVSPSSGNVWVAWRQFSTSTETAVCSFGGGYWKNHPEEWPLETIVMGGTMYTKDEALTIFNTPPRGHASYILAKQLIPAKLNIGYSLIGGEIQELIAAADVWLTDHPFDSPKPTGADKQEGLALKDDLEEFNNTPMEGDECPSIPGPDDTIMAVHSIDGGQSFSSPVIVSTVAAFEQGTTEISFRTNAYPSITVDDSGRAYLAWTTRGMATVRGDSISGDARIVVSTSTDANPSMWTSPQPIDEPDVPGHQIKPSIAFGGGQIMLTYYDLRRDISGAFERFIADWPDLPTYRHTVDLRVAHAEPAEVPEFTDYTPVTPGGPPEHPSDQVSRYAFTTNEAGDLELIQLHFNSPNLPIFVGGTMPFFGDYIDIAPSPPFLPDGDGGWRYNMYPEDGAVFHAVWTDNRDVEAPHDGDWTNYVPPGEGGESVFDPNLTVPACEDVPGGEGQTRIRNQNTYTARMSDGLYVAVPGGSRPLGDFQRAFVVFVRNDSYEDKSFRLTIGGLPDGVEASFDQFEPVSSLDVEVARYSSIARTVFVSSNDPEATVMVNVAEVTEAGPGGVIVNGGLASSVVINGDPSSPVPADSELLDAEHYNLSLMNRNVVNLSLMNLSLMNDPTMLSLMNLSLMNPALVSQELINLSLMNLSLMNLSLMNPSVINLSLMNLSLMNPAIFSLSLMNPALMTPAVTNLSLMNLSLMNPDLQNLSLMNVPVEVQEATWKVENTGTATAGYTFNMLADNVPTSDFEFQLFVYKTYTTPVADGCELKEELQQQMLVNVLDPEFLDPDDDLDKFLDPEADDPGLDNVTFYLEPGEEVYVTLWIIDLAPPDTEVDDHIEFTHEDVGAAVVAQGVNTDEVDEGGGGGDQQQPFDSDFDFGDDPLVEQLVIDPVVLPDATVGVAYSFTLTATGGQGPRTWSFQPGTAVPAGLTLDSSGNLSWTPTTAGTYDFTVRVIDYTQQDTQELSISVAPTGGPVFLVQPTTATAGNSIPDFSVMVLDDTASPVSGITVTLGIGNYACPAGTLSPSTPSVDTNGLGIATFSGVSIDRGGYGFTLEVSATVSGTLVTVESDPFGLVGFCETASMGSPRVGATSTHLANGRILVVGGAIESASSSSDLPLATAEIYNPSIPGWTTLSSTLNQGRALHTATLLGDGTVLIAGGTGNSLPATGAALNSLEIFDPASAGSFTLLVPTLTPNRMGHSATLLPDGRVLIAGGRSNAGDFTYLNSAEIFDPGTGTLSATGSLMTTGRDGHTATLLANGTALLVGGASVIGGYLRSSEVFDPSASGGLGGFAASDDMTEYRINHTATLLGDGRVLVAGGTGPGGTTHNTAEIFDPSISGGTFESSIPMSTTRERHAAMRLPNGHVLLMGGFAAGLVDSAEIFDPSIGSFSLTHSMNTARQYPLAIESGDGRIVVTGGMNLSLDAIAEAEIYWPIGGETQWTRQFGTMSLDRARGVFVHSSGVYVGGFTQGAFAGESNSGGEDAFVRKYDLDGNEVWSSQFGSSLTDWVNDLAVDASGVYVAGFTSGELPGQSTAGGEDAFVRKYDLAGNEVWTQQFGTSAEDGDFVKGISLDASGVYVAGSTGGTLPGQTKPGGIDAFVRKYDFAGNEVWTRQFGTASDETAYGISVDSSGVYVAGDTLGSLTGQPITGFNDAFVRKYDVAGNEVWTRQFGSTGRDWAFAVSVDTSGVYVAGYTWGAFVGETNSGSTDAFARKYDLAGNEVWTHQFGTTGGDTAYGISVDGSGVYLAGSTAGSLPGQIYLGNVDVFVRRYDLAGNEDWTRQFGTDSTDSGTAVSVDNSGVYVVGSTYGSLPGETKIGIYDAYVAKFLKW